MRGPLPCGAGLSGIGAGGACDAGGGVAGDTLRDRSQVYAELIAGEALLKRGKPREALNAFQEAQNFPIPGWGVWTWGALIWMPGRLRRHLQNLMFA